MARTTCSKLCYEYFLTACLRISELTWPDSRYLIVHKKLSSILVTEWRERAAVIERALAQKGVLKLSLYNDRKQSSKQHLFFPVFFHENSVPRANLQLKFQALIFCMPISNRIFCSTGATCERSIEKIRFG